MGESKIVYNLLRKICVAFKNHLIFLKKFNYLICSIKILLFGKWELQIEKCIDKVALRSNNYEHKNSEGEIGFFIWGF